MFVEPGSLAIKKGSIDLGDGAFTVDDNGFLHAEKGTIGGFDITAYDIHNDSMSLDKDGIHFWEGDHNTKSYKNIGFLGRNFWNDLPSVKSLAMNMEHDGSAIWWAYRENASDDTYTVKLMYVAKSFSDYESNTLHIFCNSLDMHGTALKNVRIDPNDGGAENGATGEFIALRSDAINDDGTIDKTKLYKVKIKNGFIVS